MTSIVRRRTLLRQLGLLSAGALLTVSGQAASPTFANTAAAPPVSETPMGVARTQAASTQAASAQAASAQSAPAADGWGALVAGGHVALIRHAEAPGVGDPPNFTLGDCATQRNLSAGGRAQADRLGAAFRERGVEVGLVLSSAWCRCVETATRAFGSAEVWPVLNSFFQDTATQAAQTEELRAGVAAWTGPGALVLVTHQVNMTALTGIFPASGEIIVLAPAPDSAAGFSVAGRVSGYETGTTVQSIGSGPA